MTPIVHDTSDEEQREPWIHELHLMVLVYERNGYFPSAQVSTRRPPNKPHTKMDIHARIPFFSRGLGPNGCCLAMDTSIHCVRVHVIHCENVTHNDHVHAQIDLRVWRDEILKLFFHVRREQYPASVLYTMRGV